MRSRLYSIKKCISTQDEARARLRENADLDIAWVLSEAMSDGRGRAGRKWISLEGNLFLSCAMRIGNFLSSGTPRNWPFVSLIGAYCWHISCKQKGLWKNNFFIKWPNDIWALKANGEAAKIGGMLAEIKGETLCFGLGLNLVASPDNLEAYESASMQDILGPFKEQEGLSIREELARRFCESFETVCSSWLSTPEAMQEKICSVLWADAMEAFRNMRFTVDAKEGAWHPKGLNLDGSLVVEDNSAKTHTVHAGDLTLLSPESTESAKRY